MSASVAELRKIGCFGDDRLKSGDDQRRPTDQVGAETPITLRGSALLDQPVNLDLAAED